MAARRWWCRVELGWGSPIVGRRAYRAFPRKRFSCSSAAVIASGWASELLIFDGLPVAGGQAAGSARMRASAAR
jgi:hypothetical protein